MLHIRFFRNSRSAEVSNRWLRIIIPSFQFFLALFLLFGHPLMAQQNHTFYYMSQVPQASLLNPAYPSECTFLGLPLISSVHANLGHSGFSYNQIFPEQNGGRIVDFSYLESRLHRLDLLNARVHVDLLSLGTSWRDYFVTFRITEKTGGMVHYPKNFFLLPWQGNRDYIGETATINRMGAQFNHYREYSFGVSGWLRDELRGGIRAKLLFGKMNLNTRHESLELTTRSDNYHIDMQGEYRVNASLPLKIKTDSNGLVTHARIRDDASWSKVLLNARNPGMGVDLGVIYTGWDRMTLYASLLDLGLIYWTSDVSSFDVQQDFEFEGLSREDLEMGDYMGMMRDSLINSYQINQTSQPYVTFMPVHTYAGMTYRVNDYLKAGFLQHNLLYKWRIYPSFILSMNAQIKDFLSLHASYSYNNYSFRNLGAGVSLQTDHWQFYAAVDNLLAIRPLNVRNINLRLGFNLFFGCAGRKAETDIHQPASGTGCFWIKRQQGVERILPDQ